MITFTLEDVDFEARQSETQNIVWFAGSPEISASYPRSFDFKEIAETLLMEYTNIYE